MNSLSEEEITHFFEIDLFDEDYFRFLLSSIEYVFESKNKDIQGDFSIEEEENINLGSNLGSQINCLKYKFIMKHLRSNRGTFAVW